MSLPGVGAIRAQPECLHITVRLDVAVLIWTVEAGSDGWRREWAERERGPLAPTAAWRPTGSRMPLESRGISPTDTPKHYRALNLPAEATGGEQAPSAARPFSASESRRRRRTLPGRRTGSSRVDTGAGHRSGPRPVDTTLPKMPLPEQGGPCCQFYRSLLIAIGSVKREIPSGACNLVLSKGGTRTPEGSGRVA
jgi:hypothetical protein